jgi:prephenate dehydrogenase
VNLWTGPEAGWANVMGVGLIGGSIGLALRANGWRVGVVDVNPAVEQEAVTRGAADRIGLEPTAAVTIIAAPVGAIPDLARRALAETTGVVTDVGSAKAEICAAVDDPRFIGGHPMAGSDQDGIAGARADLFVEAMWVLTPGETTSETAFSTVRSLIRALGAETIALPAPVHDELVALVSHVPHLTSAALMNLADSTSIEHRALLRLAAGGFRDMTRISAGRPQIWPDICVANREAIVTGLGRLIEALTQTRDLVADGDRSGLYELLDTARTARQNLPVGYDHVEKVAELAVPIPDRPGEIAAIATLAAELDVNILDLEISHSGEGHQGVMTLVVDATKGERLVGGLMARGYRPKLRDLD